MYVNAFVCVLACVKMDGVNISHVNISRKRKTAIAVVKVFPSLPLHTSAVTPNSVWKCHW